MYGVIHMYYGLVLQLLSLIYSDHVYFATPSTTDTFTRIVSPFLMSRVASVRHSVVEVALHDPFNSPNRVRPRPSGTVLVLDFCSYSYASDCQYQCCRLAASLCSCALCLEAQHHLQWFSCPEFVYSSLAEFSLLHLWLLSIWIGVSSCIGKAHWQ